MTRLGGWLFRYRTIIPAPLAIAVLGVRFGKVAPTWWLLSIGAALTILAEALRLWAVRYIGAVSRTRSERLGPLIASGPFAIVRNPLYVANIAMWVGFTLMAGLVWLAPIVAALLAFQYHAIIRWEEHLLESRLGEDYRAYADRVPRWLPRSAGGSRGLRRGQLFPRDAERPRIFSWEETVFSERGTLVAMVAAYALLWLTARS